MNLLRYLIHLFKIYPLTKTVNGHTVRFTGPMSVNREDAIEANWEEIRKMRRPGSV